MLKFVKGDMLKPTVREEAIAHGCNLIGSMGAGIAKDIAEMYPPDMLEDYRELCSEHFRLLGGKVQAVFYAEKYNLPALFNMFTQDTVWNDEHGNPPAKYEWIESALIRVVELCKEEMIKSVAMPRIGAGLGGLEWQKVKEIMIKTLSNQDIEFVVYEEFEPGLEEYEVLETIE